MRLPTSVLEQAGLYNVQEVMTDLVFNYPTTLVSLIVALLLVTVDRLAVTLPCSISDNYQSSKVTIHSCLPDLVKQHV